VAAGQTLAALAEHTGGTLRGDGTLRVDRPVHPARAERASDLALVLESAAADALVGCPAEAALVAEGLTLPPHALRGYVLVRRGRHALARVLRLFEEPPHAALGVHPSAFVDPSAAIGPRVSVGPFVAVGPRARIGADTILHSHVSIGADAVLGAGCRLHPGVRVGERVVIGDRVLLHPNVCVGPDGFSYATAERGSVEAVRASAGSAVEVTNTQIERISSLGTVVLEDDVEIGAGSTIDRATLGETRVGRGTRIDDLVLVAHNVTIGRDCLIAGQVGLSGSCRLGDRVVLAGKVGVADHITIGDDAVVTASANVGRHVPARAVVGSYAPALPREEALEQLHYLKRLKRLNERVADLTARLARLEGKP
jgi:UDP-3-O-[3-hydroxymyristoyl] glucosamine N-acyltransferase